MSVDKKAQRLQFGGMDIKRFKAEYLGRLIAQGVTPKEIEEATGATGKTVERWTKGAFFSDQNFQKVVDIFDKRFGKKPISASMVVSYELEEQEIKAGVQGEYFHVPKADVVGSCGQGSFQTSGEILDMLAFRLDWVHKKTTSPDSLVIIDVEGESMSPTLESGNIVLVDTSRKDLRDGDVYALRVGDEVYVKRLRKAPHKLQFQGDNRELSSQDVIINLLDESNHHAGSWEIIGRVIWAAKEM